MMSVHSVYGRELSSSMMKYAEYNPDTKDLDITFTNDSVYRYSEVPEDLANEFMEAESNGRFFIDNIRDKYNYVKL